MLTPVTGFMSLIGKVQFGSTGMSFAEQEEMVKALLKKTTLTPERQAMI